MLAAFLAMTACVVFSTESMKAMQTKALETIESDKRASYDEMIQNQVDNVISLCQDIYTQYEAGVYTREEAKKLAADEIRQLRYGDGGYFWVDQYAAWQSDRRNESSGNKGWQRLPNGKRDYSCRKAG